jgi:hypothetical protein
MRSACVGRSLIFNVIDPVTMVPWSNVGSNGANLFRFGSGSANCAAGRNFNFEFSYLTAASRKKMMDFMDSIPSGFYVTVRLIANVDPSMVNSYSSTWQADTTLYGSNNSLYHKMLGAGFRELDSLYKQRTWAGIYKKGDKSFTPRMVFSSGIYDAVSLAVDCNSPDTVGYITSPAYGPAKGWNKVVWQGYSEEINSADNPSVDVIGINRNGDEVVLYNMDKNTHELDISSVSALDFPYVKLKMTNMDSINRTPYQLRFWQVYYQPVPEGAITPNLYLSAKDSLEIGETLNFGIGFKNIGKVAFDSLRVKLLLIDKNNQQTQIPLGKIKGPAANDTVNVKFNLNTKPYAGNNIMLLDVNPDGEQPEQYHFNNFLYKNFYVKPDLTNPSMDVTFDGVHILNKDLVSSKPHILIKLKDNAKYLLMNDTALGTVQVRYPNGQLKTYRYNTDTLRFTPASSSQDNTATIDFYPEFPASQTMEGDEYELLVKGKDVSGNKAGETAYNVVFRVVSKPMISNMLNYPNPFSTSTAFVFTLTGSEIPQQLKIQILTVTGKIVREITREELGPLHIGRNITEFKWDGTDQFGDKLANGIYLYRVVAGLNGQQLDKYTSEGDKTSKFFNNGYGKMYLMR